MRSRRLLLAVVLTGALGCASVAPVRAGPPPQDDGWPVPALAVNGRQLNLGVGVRSFEDDEFEPLDEPVNLALDYIEPMGLGGLRLEGGLHYAWDEAGGTFEGQDVDLEAEVVELSVGLHYSLLLGRFRPYVGAGAALQFLELEGVDAAGIERFDDDASAAGGYVKGGILFQVTRTSHAGVEFRHLEGADVSFDGIGLDTDYDLLMFVFGTSFPPESDRRQR